MRFAKWDKEARKSKFKSFNSISKTMPIHYQNILNYFDNRSTNAYAKSFNAKSKRLEHNLEV
ncbi:transposase [Polaribacter sp. IC073]|uniref:transposase n=1 Tax=Polaribacter sp. IC073 TaxID=2508540 RepID=UPI001CB88D4E|nr:transposase [Polaribacter sp. IC073]